jgi:hypothetical protein
VAEARGEIMIRVWVFCELRLARPENLSQID